MRTLTQKLGQASDPARRIPPHPSLVTLRPLLPGAEPIVSVPLHQLVGRGGLRTAAGDVGQVAIYVDGSEVEPGRRCRVA